MTRDDRQETFDEWLGSHQGLIHKVVRSYAFTPHDREDLFQEIAFQLWESLPRYRQESGATTWIYRVALYSSIAWSRRERTHGERARVVEHPPVVEEPPEDPRVEWLYEQIASLDEINRSVMLLLLEGLSHREIARTLGISESNVGVKIHRIKKALARRSGPEGSNDGAR